MQTRHCPTCHCRFETSIKKALDVPSKVVSFPQHLAKNMHRLKLTDAAAGMVTLHEPCKSAYTDSVFDKERIIKVLRNVFIKAEDII